MPDYFNHDINKIEVTRISNSPSSNINTAKLLVANSTKKTTAA